MSKFLEVDKIQRETISVFFRLLIVVYICFLSFYFHLLPWYWILIELVLYFSIYLMLRKRRGVFSILRLINDYLIIGILIHFYNKMDFFTISLVFLPILNAQNHSGEKRSFLLYILPVIIFYFYDSTFQYIYAIPFLIFFLINLFERNRHKYLKFNEELYELIDTHITQRGLTKTHIMYKKIMEILNNKKGPIPLNISQMYCFRISGSKINFVNGSKFVLLSEFYDKTTLVPLEKQYSVRFISNVKCKINEVDIQNNIGFIVKTQGFAYLYMLTKKDSAEPIFSLPKSYNKMIEPLFVKLTRVIDNDYERMKFEETKLAELAQKIVYVNNANQLMHFIKNKTGPLKNYLSMAKEYEEADVEKKKSIHPFLLNERKKVQTTFESILHNTNYILEKGNNPFHVAEIKDHFIQILFIRVLSLSENELADLMIQIKLDLDEHESRPKVKYNSVGMELVLTNWLSNMKKHSDGETCCRWEESPTEYIITFYNNFKLASLEDANSFVDLYNSDDKIEIYKRKSHGIIEIKDFLIQMNIESEMFIEKDNRLYFVLKLKKYENINN